MSANHQFHGTPLADETSPLNAETWELCFVMESIIPLRNIYMRESMVEELTYEEKTHCKSMVMACLNLILMRGSCVCAPVHFLERKRRCLLLGGACLISLRSSVNLTQTRVSSMLPWGTWILGVV